MLKIKQSQLDFLNWEFGVFFHYGIRTFYEGHKDWDMKEMPLSAFNPTELDCNQWIETAKKAGAKYAILVTKHHDGFANWPSKYTDYSIKNAPWKNGCGDLVREFTDACHKHNIKCGLYYSPAEFGSKDKPGKDYDEYFINQINELLCNYGKIDYLWFDGCGSENHLYDEKRIIKAIRSAQPDMLIFNMWDPDTRWVGNEAGYADIDNKNLVSALDFSVLTDEKDELGAVKFLPAECDCMNRSQWFFSENNDDTLKSSDELFGLYMYSVGRGANLLLNIPPDKRGLLPEKDTKELLSFGEKVRKLYENPVANLNDAEKSGNTFTFSFPEGCCIQRVILRENLSNGDKTTTFKIKLSPKHGKTFTVFEGHTIGHKRICTFPMFRAYKAEIEIDSGILENIDIY